MGLKSLDIKEKLCTGGEQSCSSDIAQVTNQMSLQWGRLDTSWGPSHLIKHQLSGHNTATGGSAGVAHVGDFTGKQTIPLSSGRQRNIPPGRKRGQLDQAPRDK